MMRRKARELALQILFQMDLAGHDVETALADGIERDQPETAIQEYTGRLVRGVAAHQADVDAEITRRAREWTMDRMATVDRNILRIGMYELMYCPDVPDSVIANEAVELAKLFSTADSSRFVNGILGAVIRERGGKPPELPEQAPERAGVPPEE